MGLISTVRGGVSHLPSILREYGVAGGMKRFCGLSYWRLAHNVEGRSIFSEDWDVCIILDACRADELRRQKNGFEWLNHVETFPSLASCTYHWMPRTFSDGRFEDTVYVCSNPFSQEFLKSDDFQILDEVWKYAWDDQKGTVLPRPVTDRAIQHGRETNFDRMVVHYLQPHVPFLVGNSNKLDKANFELGRDGCEDDWTRVTRGDLDRETAIENYRVTLSTVLNEVDTLVSNIDAEDVVITADHGEAFGEWGLYGHPFGVNLPCLTAVPWVETRATDQRTHNPDEYDREAQVLDRDKQLQSLGYK